MAEAAPQLFFLALLMGAFYFLLIRPQKKRAQHHRDLISSVEIGDDIVTIGGLHGTVRGITDSDVELEIAPGVKVSFIKSAIARKVEAPEDEEV